MLKSSMGDWKIPNERFSIPSLFLFVSVVIALLLAAVSGGLDPLYSLIAIGLVFLLVIIVLCQFELAATIILAVHLYVDWYLGYKIVGTAMALGLLLLLFLAQGPGSPRHSWVSPRGLWLWALFLALTIFPTIQGAITLGDAFYYYPNIIFGAFIIFWLGMVIARNSVHLRTLFKLLAAFGTLLAIHSLIQAATGTFLFASARAEIYLAQTNYTLLGSDIQRIGSIFFNPDWNGTFLAMMLFLPLGLFVETTSFVERLLYIGEMFFMLVALLSTYSNGGWVGAFAGIMVFVFFLGRGHYRLYTFFALALVALIVLVSFPAQINLQLYHATDPAELSIRTGTWQTAIRVIEAFPLTGIGLGLTNYLQRAEPYRVSAQVIPLAHPHNSYLELGAMAGLPVLLVFVALLLFALWQVWRNWMQADEATRSLLGGGLAVIISLSVNSISINGWTLPPLAAIGWLILGSIASPLILKKQPVEPAAEKNS